MSIVDSHCHLTDRKFADKIDVVVKRAVDGGVMKMIVPGTDLKDVKKVVELTRRFENVYGLAGIHPETIDHRFQILDLKGKLQIAIQSNPKIVGIGEIGLDCYWNRRNLKKQTEVFKRQLELAVEIDLPVVIHSRLAAEEIREVFESMEKLPRGQFHCFGESEEFLDYILARGFYVSFCGNVTYKSAENLRKLVKKVPLERLLTETDSPYLSPEPVRGTANEPINVKIVAKFLADLRGETMEKFARVTSENAERLFNI